MLFDILIFFNAIDHEVYTYKVRYLSKHANLKEFYVVILR
jgi:hypothetical protein